MKTTTHFIQMNNKKYTYKLKTINKKWTYFECDAANMGQRFLSEDIPALLIDLPELIIMEHEYQKQQSEIIRFRLSQEQKKQIQLKAAKQGFTSVSEFMRNLALKAS